MLNAVLALNDLDTHVFESPEPGTAPRIYESHVTVPDAHLLFNGEFKRVGTSDLKIVGDDGQSFFIADYFAADKRAALMSPDGATLSASVVEALAGPLAAGQLAQAGGQAASAQPVIGRVDALAGSATVVRNGVTVALNVGDNVRKGDVVQTSGSSSVAIVFSDGTTFSLNANARMVLNDFVYAAGGTGNSAAISLVQGTFSFVAGQVAKTGDMRVETPVATMGIRGTAVLVEISANDGQTKFSVMVEPDGTTGAFNLYSKTTGALIGTVNNSSVGWVVTPAGPLQVVAQQVQKTPAELQQELGIVQQIFTIFNNNQQNPFVPQDSPERRGDNPNDTNPQTAGSSGSGGALTVTVPVTTPDNPTPTNVTVTITPVNTIESSITGPQTPVIDVPAPSNIPAIPTLNIINGSGTITGTPGNDQITGSDGDDIVDSLAGDDFVFAGDGDDVIVAAHGAGEDFYDGGTHIHGDTIKYTSANGVVFNLNNGTFNLGGENIVKSSTASSSTTGTDVFVRVEKIVGSSGNDVFILNDNFRWALDGGTGIDIVRLAGNLSFTGDVDGPDVHNIEIVDLNTIAANIVDFDADGVAEFNDAHTIWVIGGSDDTVNLNEYYPGAENGTWVLRGSASDPFGDDLTPGNLTFEQYEFVDGENVLATIYVQDVVEVALPNEAPIITAADSTGSVSAGAPISSVAAGYLASNHNLINNLGSPQNRTESFGEGLLGANDDGSTPLINITSVFGEQGLNFFGSYYTAIYINNNGNITFTGPLGAYTPSQIAGGSSNPIIAPFWADIDTRGGDATPTPGGNSAGSNLVYYDLDSENGVVTITWDDVGYFSSATDKLNAFQLQLIDRGGGNFDIVFRYEDINWTTGSASGGTGGLGGTPARAGYTAGDGTPAHYFELTSSGNQNSMLALESTAGNTGLNGVYVFEVRSGEVGNPTSTGTIAFSDADTTDTHTVSANLNLDLTGHDTTLGTLHVTVTNDTTGGGNGLVTWNYVANPAAVSDLAPGTVQTEIYDVVISDGHGGTVTQQVTITINGPANEPDNSPPTAEAVIASGNEDASFIPVILNSSDTDGAVEHFRLLSLPENGQLYTDIQGSPLDQDDLSTLLEAAGNNLTLYFKPDENWNGQTTFQFKAIDDDGSESVNTGTATIDVASVNDAPQTVTPELAEGAENQQARIPIYLQGTDSDGYVSGFKILSLPAGGSLFYLDGSAQENPLYAGSTIGAPSQTGVATIFFRPLPDFSGTVTFEIAAVDNDGSQDQTPATATITITPDSLPTNAPVIHIEDAATYEKDGEDNTGTTLYGLTVTDDDASEEDEFHITVTAEHGTLSPADPLLIEADESPEDPQSMSFHATLADINEALAQGIVYTDPEYDGENSEIIDTVTLTVTDADNNSDSMNFIFSVFGDTGVNLVGSAAKDVMFSTGHNDTFTGAGGNDTFVFGNEGENGSGQDIITDFTQNQDRIALYGYASMSDFTLDNTDQGIEIDLGDGSTVILSGFHGNLSATDFIFHPSNVLVA